MERAEKVFVHRVETGTTYHMCAARRDISSRSAIISITVRSRALPQKYSPPYLLSQGEEVLQCLEFNLHNSGMTDKCASTIKSRMRKEHSNYKLNVGLKKACKTDISMHCGDVIKKIISGSTKDGEFARHLPGYVKVYGGYHHLFHYRIHHIIHYISSNRRGSGCKLS